MESRMSRLQLSTPEDGEDSQAGSDSEEDFSCEYRDEIWRSLLEQEAQKPQIHLTSPQLEFRGALVQRLRAAARRLRLGGAALHAAVQLLDLFMDRHELRADRLAHSALAALSLAAKSEEKFSRAPRLSMLSRVSGVPLSAATFRQLEWMMGQHVGWRLLLPTAATFASLAAHHVVRDDDLASRSPELARRLRRDGARLLRSYLDLTLSDVRLKVMSAAEVGCACVACARASLGLPAWPSRVAAAAGVTAARVAPVARLLQGMMRVLQSREPSDPAEADQGYGSARASPAASPPPAAPRAPPAPTVETAVVRRDQLPVQKEFHAGVVKIEPVYQPAVSAAEFYSYRNPKPHAGLDYGCMRSQRLIEASLEIIDSKGVKRTACRDVNSLELERKRFRVEVPSQRLL